mmetsp:Transcript_39736/g.83026  ORF Transcript_39736/g.83026 Transcript_39736/m.83026 type:complete len:284 (-) Transcript_39736:787-1638(-)
MTGGAATVPQPRAALRARAVSPARVADPPPPTLPAPMVDGTTIPGAPTVHRPRAATAVKAASLAKVVTLGAVSAARVVAEAVAPPAPALPPVPTGDGVMMPGEDPIPRRSRLTPARVVSLVALPSAASPVDRARIPPTPPPRVITTTMMNPQCPGPMMVGATMDMELATTTTRGMEMGTHTQRAKPTALAPKRAHGAPKALKAAAGKRSIPWYVIAPETKMTIWNTCVISPMRVSCRGARGPLHRHLNPPPSPPSNPLNLSGTAMDGAPRLLNPSTVGSLRPR